MDYPKSVPSVGLVGGKFVDEDALAGTPGSLIPAQWGNAVTEEMLNVLTAAGLAPDELNNSQLLLAISRLSLISTAQYAVGTAAGNALSATYAPAVTALTDGMVLKCKSPFANTAPATFNPNGLGAKVIVGGAHSALQGGEIAANSELWLQYNSSIGGGSWVIVASSGGAAQVGQASKSQHAIQLGQMAAVVGGARNAKMLITGASASGTFAASEVAVKSALGGPAWLLPAFSKTINLASTGAGGMDAGAAPANGFVAIYAIFNPTTGVSALLGTNATAAIQPEVYGGANMPSGYTHSALISVWPTTAASLLVAACQFDRVVYIAPLVALTTSTQQLTAALLALPGVPKNAKSFGGSLLVSTNTASALSCGLQGTATGFGGTAVAAQNNTLIQGTISNVPLVVEQQTYYLASAGAGTMTFTLALTNYAF